MSTTPRKSLGILGWAGRTLMAVSCLSLVLPPTAQASGGSSRMPDIPSAAESPEQNAERHYKQGLKYRDKAWELEKKAAMAQGAAAEKLMKKTRKEYSKAVKSQRKAVTANPRMHQAHSSLGYALRKTGEFDEALEAYGMALKIAPGYTEAIEYRAEAYLALDRLEDAKSAYLTLLRVDQARADELMAAMKKGVSQGENGSAEVSEADLEAFSSWVEERADIAGHAVMVVTEQMPGQMPGQVQDW